MVQSKSFFFIAVFGVLSIFSLSSFIHDAAEEYGKAGYYADSLHGRKTKSGEVYDKNKFTCAHMTLPFGTKIRVTRLDNDRSVVVTVNDRGKFVEGYIVDLSRAAAEQVDLIKKGVARVKVEIVEEATTSSTKKNASSKLMAARQADAADEEEMREAATQSLKPVEYRSSKKRASSTSLKSAKGAYLEPVEYTSRVAKAEAPKKANSSLYKINMKKATKNGFAVQVCTLNDGDNVLPIVEKLEKHFPNKVMISAAQEDGEHSYKVLVGPAKDKKAAQAEQKKVAKYYKESYVVDLSEI